MRLAFFYYICIPLVIVFYMVESKKTLPRKKAGTTASASTRAASSTTRTTTTKKTAARSTVRKKTATTATPTAKKTRKKRTVKQKTFLERINKQALKYTDKGVKQVGRFSWTLGKCLALVLVGVLISVFVYIKFINPYAFKLHPVTHPKGYTVYGVDLSHYQGNVDWRQLQDAKVDGHKISFVFVKATEGADYVDNRFSEYFTKARDNGFIRGAYHFYVPSTQPYFQIQSFIRNVDLEEGDFPPVLDVETDGGVPKEHLQNDILQWLAKIEEYYKVKPIIYTSVKFKKKYLDRSEFDEYPLWIANYSDSLTYKGEWEFWQYSDAGKVDGIGDYVDLNVYHTTTESMESLVIHH